MYDTIYLMLKQKYSINYKYSGTLTPNYTYSNGWKKTKYSDTQKGQQSQKTSIHKCWIRAETHKMINTYVYVKWSIYKTLCPNFMFVPTKFQS